MGLSAYELCFLYTVNAYTFIGVRADFLGGLNQFCPKNPGQSGNFSGRRIARLPEKKTILPDPGSGGCSPPPSPPAHTPLYTLSR